MLLVKKDKSQNEALLRYHPFLLVTEEAFKQRDPQHFQAETTMLPGCCKLLTIIQKELHTFGLRRLCCV